MLLDGPKDPTFMVPIRQNLPLTCSLIVQVIRIINPESQPVGYYPPLMELVISVHWPLRMYQIKSKLIGVKRKIIRGDTNILDYRSVRKDLGTNKFTSMVRQLT